MKLVIVESPTKAKTITRFLGKEYKVLASFGHVRDLPKSKLGVDIEHDFEPTYTVSADHKDKVKDIKAAAKKADAVLFATDEDREGESISWHLVEVLKPRIPTKRMVFHEITKEAIQAAQENTRELDTALVDAQETRRILDRLYGWEMSDVMRRRVGPGTSAGRVQTVALRLVVGG